MRRTGGATSYRCNECLATSSLPPDVYARLLKQLRVVTGVLGGTKAGQFFLIETSCWRRRPNPQRPEQSHPGEAKALPSLLASSYAQNVKSVDPLQSKSDASKTRKFYAHFCSKRNTTKYRQPSTLVDQKPHGTPFETFNKEERHTDISGVPQVLTNDAEIPADHLHYPSQHKFGARTREWKIAASFLNINYLSTNVLNYRVYEQHQLCGVCCRIR